jgi:hypothetical protein
MRKIKIFKSVENELEVLEKDVNDWLAQTGYRLISLTGNIASQGGGGSTTNFGSSDILIIVVYEDTQE